MGYLETGKREGAKVVTGGGRPADLNLGYYVAPTLFSGNNDMVIAREEIFGPVAVMMTHKGDEDALRIANDTEYGLNGAVYSSDPDRAYKAMRRVRAGNVTHNDWVVDPHFPFGGFKQSGIGRDKSLHALEKYTELKTTWIDLS